MSKSFVEINWHPDKSVSKPSYIQISDYITEKIRSGEWTAGAFLPNQRELAKLLKVNRSTAVAALEELKAIGLIETNGKGGTKVAVSQMPTQGPKQPDWNSYISEGFHISNLDTIQVINRYEFTNDHVRLSSGEPSPDMYPADMMGEVLREMAVDIKSLGYEEPKGMPYLREQVCKYLSGFGIKASPENVLIVSGALQAIQLVTIGLLQPGSSVFLERPSYLYSLNIFQSVGMRRYAVPMDDEGVIPSYLEQHRSKHRQSILYTVPNFHNPTGIVMSENRRRELYDTCGRIETPIIEDDVYRELWIDEEPPLAIKSLDINGSVLYVGSISKALSTGLRIGWLVGPEAVVDRLGDLKMQNDYGSSSLAQIAVAKFMDKGYYAKHCANVRENLKLRRNVAIEALNRYFTDIASWNIPAGGYYIWINFKYPIKMNTLFNEGFNKGILTYPGYLYDSSNNQSLRISYSYANVEEMESAIKTLSIIAKKLIKLETVQF